MKQNEIVRFEMQLPAKLKKQAEKKAASDSRKLSAYLRLLIQKDLASDLVKK